MKDITAHSLLYLNGIIQQTIKENFPTLIWIQTEISQLVEKNGHAYIDFVEKDKLTDKIIAKSRAICWANTYAMLKPYFENTTNEKLRVGIKIMVAISVEFSELYGISLNIKDINPIFTIGEMANRRLEIIKKLETDGIFEMNKSLVFPPLMNRLAIISSPTAAGYDDFCNQLEQNPYQFHFYKKLFPAIMQGEKSEASIIAALDKIYAYSEHFDTVLILRGGGATTDLACFDSYPLATNIAQFPLPIICGIGHQRDISIADMVAHTSVKTPTAAAEFLIGKMLNCNDRLTQLTLRITQIVTEQLNHEKTQLNQFKTRLENCVKMIEMKQRFEFQNLINKFIKIMNQKLQIAKAELDILSLKIENNSPQRVLDKGYSLTFINGERMQSVTGVCEGDKWITYLADGSLEGRVEVIKNTIE